MKTQVFWTLCLEPFFLPTLPLWLAQVREWQITPQNKKHKNRTRIMLWLYCKDESLSSTRFSPFLSISIFVWILLLGQIWLSSKISTFFIRQIFFSSLKIFFKVQLLWLSYSTSLNFFVSILIQELKFLYCVLFPVNTQNTLTNLYENVSGPKTVDSANFSHHVRYFLTGILGFRLLSTWNTFKTMPYT